MTYIDFTSGYILNKKIGQPIYSSEIAVELGKTFSLALDKAIAATAVALKRIITSGKIKLRFYQKGIYYLTEVTPFGEIGINTNYLITDKYLKNNQGYITGLSFLNILGLTTQIPNSQELVTNAAKNGTRFDEKLEVTIHPPKKEITKENKLYFQLLDGIECLNKAPIDNDSPYKFIAKYISKANLKYQKLLAYCFEYYNIAVMEKLAHIASEGENA